MDRASLKKEAKEIISNRLWDFWKPLLIYYFITLLVELVIMKIISIRGGVEILQNENVEMIVNFVLSILLLPVSIGMNKYHLDYVRGNKLNLGNLKDYFGNIIPLLGLYFSINILTALGTICLIIPGIIISLALNFAYYLYIDEEKGVIETIKDSFSLMKGHKWELFVLVCSFLGWAILGAFTFGILYIWLVPYMNTTLMLYYDKLKEVR